MTHNLNALTRSNNASYNISHYDIAYCDIRAGHFLRFQFQFLLFNWAHGVKGEEGKVHT